MKLLFLKSTIGWAVSLFALSAIIGLGASYNPALSLPTALTAVFSAGLFFVVVRLKAGAPLVAKILAVAGGLLALYFVGRYGYLPYPDETGLLSRLGRLTGSILPNAAGFAPHPNAVATFLEGAFFPAIALTAAGRGPKRWAWAAVSAVIVYGLLITGSRGAWLGLAAMALVWAVRAFPRRGPLVLGLAFGLGGGLLLGAWLVFRLAQPGEPIPVLTSALGAAQSRLTLYRNSLYLLGDYPFTGIGPGNTFAMVYSRYQLLIDVPFLYYAHNQFLSVWLGQGLLGLMAWLWLLIAFVKGVIRVEKRLPADDDRRRWFRVGWLGVGATMMHGLLDAAQFSGAFWTMPVVFALAGLAVAQAGGRWMSRIPSSVGLRRVGIVGGAAAILVTGSMAFAPPVASMWQTNAGAVVQTRAELAAVDGPARTHLLAQAEGRFRQALTLNPAQAAANKRLGILLLAQNQFDPAVGYLQTAYNVQPRNQAVIKALGYAFLWTGQADHAEVLFRQVEFQSRLLAELQHWVWQRQEQDRPQLAAYADEMFRRLQK